MPQKKQEAIYVSKLRQRTEEVLEASSGYNGDPGKLSPDEMKILTVLLKNQWECT